MVDEEDEDSLSHPLPHSRSHRNASPRIKSRKHRYLRYLRYYHFFATAGANDTRVVSVPCSPILRRASEYF